MADDTEWMVDQIRKDTFGSPLKYSSLKMGYMWRIGVSKVKASALVYNYNTTQCGSIEIRKVRIRFKTTAGVDLDCDPGCTGSC